MATDNQFRHAQVNHESSCDCCGRDDSREDEIVAIVEHQMDDVPYVAEAIESLFEASDLVIWPGGLRATHFAADLARVLTASDAAFQADALHYFRELRKKVREQLTAEAASLSTDNEGPDEAPLPWET
jgi:hypothetical protein